MNGAASYKTLVCENEVQFHMSLAAHLSATPTYSSGVWSLVAVMPRRCSRARTIGQRFQQLLYCAC
jgi:hypothetical protein